MTKILFFLLVSILLVNTTQAEELHDIIIDPYILTMPTYDAVIGVDLEPRFITNEMLPLLNGPGPFIIDMTRMNNQKEPVKALIQIDGAKHCLIEYNNVCVIAGNKLTLE